MVTSGAWQDAKNEESKVIKEYIRGKLEEKPDYNLIELGGEISEVIDNKAADRFVKDCKKNGGQNYRTYILKLVQDLMPIELSNNEYYGMTEMSRQNLVVDYSPSYYPPLDNNGSKIFFETLRKIFPCITFAHIYILLITYLIIIIKKLLICEIPWINMGLFSVVLLMVLSGLMGTFAEWGRTVITVMPFCWTMIAILIEKVLYLSDINILC